MRSPSALQPRRRRLRNCVATTSCARSCGCAAARAGLPRTGDLWLAATVSRGGRGLCAGVSGAGWGCRCLQTDLRACSGFLLWRVRVCGEEPLPGKGISAKPGRVLTSARSDPILSLFTTSTFCSSGIFALILLVKYSVIIGVILTVECSWRPLKLLALGQRLALLTVDPALGERVLCRTSVTGVLCV